MLQEVIESEWIMFICYDEIHWNLFGSKIIVGSYHKITRYNTRKIASWIIFFLEKKKKKKKLESEKAKTFNYLFTFIYVLPIFYHNNRQLASFATQTTLFEFVSIEIKWVFNHFHFWFFLGTFLSLLIHVIFSSKLQKKNIDEFEWENLLDVWADVRTYVRVCVKRFNGLSSLVRKFMSLLDFVKFLCPHRAHRLSLRVRCLC